MLRVAIVEDDPQVQQQLCAYLRHYSQKRGLAFKTGVFSDGLQIAAEYTPEWDILFMDIQMPVMDGMEAARRIRQTDPEVVIIFITNMAQYAMKGYEVNALDFVLKPVDEAMFQKRLEAAVSRLSHRSKQYLALRSRSGIFKLDTDAIRCIQVFQHNLQISLAGGETRTARGTINQVETQLDPLQFSKCNSGAIVNLRYVTEIRGEDVLLDGMVISLSRRRRKPFLQAMADYLGGVL